MKPDELFERVTAALDYIKDSGRNFPTADSERAAVARAVLRLIPPHARPGNCKGKYLRHLGEVLISRLGPAALSMLRTFKREQEEDRARIAASTRFDIQEPTPPAETHVERLS